MKLNSLGRQPVEPEAQIQSSPRRGRHIVSVECVAPCGSSGFVCVPGIHGLTPEARCVSPLSGLIRTSRGRVRCKETVRGRGLTQTGQPYARGTAGRMRAVQTLTGTFTTLPEPVGPNRSLIRCPIPPRLPPLKDSHTLLSASWGQTPPSAGDGAA